MARNVAEARRLTNKETGGARVEVARQKFVTLEAPGEQPILMKEIEPNPASEWRAGMNLMPGDLETKMLKLVQKEMDAAGVCVSRNDDGTMCLVAAKHLHEGATICPLTSLIFDSEHALEHFLNHGWHRMLLAESHIIEVQGVLAAGGSKTSVYAVPIGIGKHLHHFAGIRKSGPNVQLVVDVGKGANDDRSGRGIKCDVRLAAVVMLPPHAPVACAPGRFQL